MKVHLFLLSLVLITSCTLQNNQVECNSDSDCAPAGCSSQLCVQKEKASEIITTCEYKQEYECLKLTNCGCINNKCSWKENQEYKECIDNL
nr:eight-cysteine-cluster domain-containing protein [Candidatus Woesearchaeota archaeon]